MMRYVRAFERLDPESGPEGLGLGLSIVARVVERHGGRIRAEGAPGQGARFRFTLAPDQPADAND